MPTRHILLPLLLFSCGLLHAQTLNFASTHTPAETTVQKPLRLYFNAESSDADGNPAGLEAATQVQVNLPPFDDEETGLSVLPANATWHFPEGFVGGRRFIETAVVGTSPSESATLMAPLTMTLADGTVIEKTVEILVRAGATEGGNAELCIQPGDGGELGPWVGFGLSPGWRIYTDFRPLLAVGSAQFKDAPAATIKNSMEFEVVEVLEDGETAPAPFTIDNRRLRVVDSDNDGTAEAIHFGVRISRSEAIEVSFGEVRRFEIRATRTDVLPTPVASLAQFELEVRARVSFAEEPVLGFDDEISVGFERDQSRALNVRPVLYRNGNQLPPAAQATAAVLGNPLNGELTETGLYDLGWFVDVDFTRLTAISGFVVGDTLGVELRFPGISVQPLLADLEVFEDGINATTFKDIEDLEEKIYDNGTTEKDLVETLVEALCDAGLEVDDDGGLALPDPFEDEGLDPQWGDVQETLDEIRNAALAYKNAPRLVDGEDCLERARKWKVSVTIKKDGKDIPVVIARDTSGKGTNAKSKRNMDCALVIAIGMCGEDPGDDGEATNGSGAAVELKGRNSVGIAVGGNGGEGGAENDGGDGGSANANTKGGSSNTAIALGGHGGSTTGTGSKGGSGGDAGSEVTGRSSNIVEAGASGSQEVPPPKADTATGSASLTNPDATERNGKDSFHWGPGILDGKKGITKGGIVRAKPDSQIEDDNPKVRIESDPTSGE